MSSEVAFVEQVRDALHHLYDYATLESHPLARQYWPRVRGRGPNRAQRLHRLLLETLEELHPPAARQTGTSHARAYSLLVYRYVEELPLPRIQRQLGLSRRQFFREQTRAIAMLAAALWEKLPQQTPAPAEPTDLLAAEAGRVLDQSESLDARDVIEAVLDVVRPLAAQQGVILEQDFGPGPCVIRANRTLLRQVFVAALSAMITSPGTHRIALRLIREGRAVVVDLIGSDSTRAHEACGRPGGIQPDLERLRRLVAMMGFRWEEKLPGPGERIWRFSLPADGQDVLLVIEDNEAVIESFRRQLIGYSYDVVGATSGPRHCSWPASCGLPRSP